MSDYYITIGKRGSAKLREGDQKTPIGIYHVTSSLPRQKLTDFYGSGAFPINYPNEWDKRQGRSGHGIWLHGTPSDTYSRPPRASDGCVVLSNADLDQLGKSVQTGLTPVVIAEGIEWIKNDELLRERKQMREVVEQWRTDWESRNHERYMQHYSRNFSSGGVNHASWDRQKQQVNAGKEWLKIGISNLSIVRNPGQEEFMVVNFEQDYRSSNLHNQMRKRQYWVKESGRWRIIYEGNG
jgi:murein L,D-transpeptidase YafK